MSLTSLSVAVFFILFGLSSLGWVAVSVTVLGAVALIAGILIVVDAWHPVTLGRRAV